MWEDSVDERMHTWTGAGSLLALPPTAGVDIVRIVFLVTRLDLFAQLV
jgi:hypothetical protein